MAELSPTTVEPTATAVATPQDVPAPEASTEAPSSEAQAPEVISVDQYREKLKSGEITKAIAESGMPPTEWIEKFVKTDAPTEESEAEPELKEAPVEEKVKDEEKPKVGRPKSKGIRDVKDFVKALRDRGFNYDSIDKALDGYVNKEAAVDLYRTESRKFRDELVAERTAREADNKRVQSLQKELEDLRKEKAKIPDPIKPVYIPTSPQLSTDDLMDVDKVTEYQEGVRKREDALLKESQRMMQEQAVRYETKLSELTNSVKSLTSEFENNKRREAVIEAENSKKMKLQNAFMAAEDFMGKVSRYKTSKPFDKVHEEFMALQKDALYIANSVAGFKGYDLIGEYLSGNKLVQDEFARREIEVSDDIKNYLTIAQLEGDAIKHNLMVNGRPDMVKALRLREEDEGIRTQEIHEAKLEGYDQAAEIQRGHSTAPRTMPISSSAAPPDGPAPMTVSEVRSRMAEIRKMTNKAAINAAMSELQPHIERLQNESTS